MCPFAWSWYWCTSVTGISTSLAVQFGNMGQSCVAGSRTFVHEGEEPLQELPKVLLIKRQTLAFDFLSSRSLPHPPSFPSGNTQPFHYQPFACFQHVTSLAMPIQHLDMIYNTGSSFLQLQKASVPSSHGMFKTIWWLCMGSVS